MGVPLARTVMDAEAMFNGASSPTATWHGPPVGGIPRGKLWQKPWENIGISWGNHRKTIGKPIGKWRFTLWLCQNSELEHGHRNSEFSHWKWWISSSLCKRLPEGSKRSRITSGGFSSEKMEAMRLCSMDIWDGSRQCRHHSYHPCTESYFQYPREFVLTHWQVFSGNQTWQWTNYSICTLTSPAMYIYI